MENLIDNLTRWIFVAENLEAEHIIDVLDEFDMVHYPIYVYPNDNIDEVKSEINDKSMTRVYDVYTIQEAKKYIDKFKG